jgi:hypothetical protein
VSTWDNRSPQASDTRKPCRNINRSKHRSRAALRLSLATSRSFSTSAVAHHFVQCSEMRKARNASIGAGRIFRHETFGFLLSSQPENNPRECERMGRGDHAKTRHTQVWCQVGEYICSSHCAIIGICACRSLVPHARYRIDPARAVFVPERSTADGRCCTPYTSSEANRRKHLWHYMVATANIVLHRGASP